MFRKIHLAGLENWMTFFQCIHLAFYRIFGSLVWQYGSRYIYGVLYGLLKHGEHSCFAGSEADFSSSSSTGSIKGRGTMANNSTGKKNFLSHRWSIVPRDFGINTHSSFFIYININGEAHFIAHLLGWFKMLYHFVECFYISQVPSYSSSVIASNQSCCLVFSAL